MNSRASLVAWGVKHGVIVPAKPETRSAQAMKIDNLRKAGREKPYTRSPLPPKSPLEPLTNGPQGEGRTKPDGRTGRRACGHDPRRYVIYSKDLP